MLSQACVCEVIVCYVCVCEVIVRVWLSECVVVVCVCWCCCDGGGGRRRPGGGRDTESKTRTPHKDVGKVAQ